MLCFHYSKCWMSSLILEMSDSHIRIRYHNDIFLSSKLLHDGEHHCQVQTNSIGLTPGCPPKNKHVPGTAKARICSSGELWIEFVASTCRQNLRVLKLLSVVG